MGSGPCGGRSVAPQAVFAARMTPARLRPAKRSRVDRRHCPVGQNSANDHGDDSVQSSACCPGQLPLSCMRCDSFHVGLNIWEFRDPGTTIPAAPGDETRPANSGAPLRCRVWTGAQSFDFAKQIC